ncbi:MAG: hypothetical protein OXU79_11990 [Gemmatimonadota bacterium]|nr:hypothetical protein [Gemmatimonadota bacterium]
MDERDKQDEKQTVSVCRRIAVCNICNGLPNKNNLIAGSAGPPTPAPHKAISYQPSAVSQKQEQESKAAKGEKQRRIQIQQPLFPKYPAYGVFLEKPRET